MSRHSGNFTVEHLNLQLCDRLIIRLSTSLKLIIQCKIEGSIPLAEYATTFPLSHALAKVQLVMSIGFEFYGQVIWVEMFVRPYKLRKVDEAPAPETGQR
jgi:hypothetical protein